MDRSGEALIVTMCMIGLVAFFVLAVALVVVPDIKRIQQLNTELDRLGDE